MKITKARLKQIIKEELEGVMSSEPEYLQKARQRNPVPRQGRKGSFPAEVFKGNMDYLMDFGARLKSFADTPDNATNAAPYLKNLYRQILGEVDSLVNHFNKEGQVIGGSGGQNYDVTDLQMFSGGSIATATATIGTGFVKSIDLLNDGSGFTSAPTIGITTAPSGGINATAVGLLTTRNNVTSIEEIVITNSGAGYTVAPVVTISGGGGVGAAATALIRSDGKKGIIRISIGGTGGVGYSTTPNVSISLPSLSPQLPASARAEVGAGGTISNIFIQNAGAGFFSPPTITVGPPSSVGIGSGSYWFNELVTGNRSNASARVKRWDLDTKILQVGIETGTFLRGEVVTGSRSGAQYTIQVSAANTDKDKYDHSDEIEDEADQILDFTESNPFGLF